MKDRRNDMPPLVALWIAMLIFFPFFLVAEEMSNPEIPLVSLAAVIWMLSDLKKVKGGKK